MPQKKPSDAIRSPAEVFYTGPDSAQSIPIVFASEPFPQGTAKDLLSDANLNWLNAIQFKPQEGKHAIVPAADGAIATVVIGLGDGNCGEPCGPSELLVGNLAASLPAGTYHLAQQSSNSELAAIAWGLGAYRFQDYRKQAANPCPRLVMPASVDAEKVLNIVEAIWFGRDLINRPASDLGPEQLEAAARDLAKRHGADIEVIAGDDLLAKNFPLIHAVGRASSHPPRLIDIKWHARQGADPLPTLTLVGKGICFDTGGLDLKTAAGMLLMKKDMGGAAAVLSLAHMIMGQNLGVALRVLIPAAENSVSGNAFRPSDILTSRCGKTVEIGNTDAEGRLVLADAVSFGDESAPQTMITFATLTGAARVALGPDLPALFSTDGTFAKNVIDTGNEIGDPLWQMPFWNGYSRFLESHVADIGNVAMTPFAGAITAALFLKTFIQKTERYAHIDLYGWRPTSKPLGPKGGEPQAARAVLNALCEELAT